MKVITLLHYAFRARNPDALGRFYAETFDGEFFLHPVMSGLGIVIVKLHSPTAMFHGLLEFWPWDVVWDGKAAEFRRIPPSASPTSYGHVALKIDASVEDVVAELKRRGIEHRMEPRAPGVAIPTIDDPEGNMIELFCRIDHMPLPPTALCSCEKIDVVTAAVRLQFARATAGMPHQGPFPLLMDVAGT